MATECCLTARLYNKVQLFITTITLILLNNIKAPSNLPRQYRYHIAARKLPHLEASCGGKAIRGKIFRSQNRQYYAQQKIDNYSPVLIEMGKEYASEHGQDGEQITEESALALGTLAFQDKLAAKNGGAESGAEDRTVEMDGMGYTWNPSEGIRLLWAEEATVTGLHQSSAGDMQEQANEAIDNILYKKYLGEEVAEEDYAILYQFGMNDIVEYLKGVETIEYVGLSESTREQIKEVVMNNGYYAYFDFTPEQTEFFKTATVEMIDQRIAEESAKAEPDEHMLDALNLYRYYKNDLGIEVTGDYEVDRTAAKKVFVERLCELTGADSLENVLMSYAALHAGEQDDDTDIESLMPEEWQQADRILAEAPPELFINTAEETQATLESTGYAIIGGFTDGISLGLASLKKESVVDPDEYKRLALLGWKDEGTEFYRNGRFYEPGNAEQAAIVAQYNKWAYMIGNIVGTLPITIATGGLASSAAYAMGVRSVAALNAISGAVPAMIRSGISTAGAGGDAGEIIFNVAMDGAFAAVSFGTLGTAAETAVGSLLSKAPALLKMTLPVLSSATVTAIADTGLNILSDMVMGRDIDWRQTFATMGVDFLFSLFLNGKSGDNAYTDPATGKNIDIPAGKTLADIDPEVARFYDALGDTKVTGELHATIGDMYTQYLDIPESIVPRSEFKGLETAYRNYEANATVRNASAFLDEAGKVYAKAGDSGYRIDNPYSRVNTAIEADFAARQNIMSDGEVDWAGTEPNTQDGTSVKSLDGDAESGYNGRQGVSASKGKVITEITYRPSSGVELKATPGKTTTILGSYEIDMKNIVNEMGNVKSTNFGPNDGGFNVLNVPDELYDPNTFWDLYNRPWLDEAIKRGDDIILATKPEGTVMRSFNKLSGEWGPSGFAREYDYLWRKGYHYDPTTNMMVK